MKTVLKRQLRRGPQCVRQVDDIRKYLLIVPDAITEAEEEAIINFVQPKLQRKRYEGDHWDSVITNYKETEMSTINMPLAVSMAVNRVSQFIRNAAGSPDMIMMPPHVLDLSADGFIGVFYHTTLIDEE